MSENVWLWSLTASDNDDADPAVPWPENMLPGAVNNAARSTMAALARVFADINGTLATTGSSNAYAATSNSGVTAFINGQMITVRANFTNTGACTLNLNSFGAKSIKTQVNVNGAIDLLPGQIVSGGRYQLVYELSSDTFIILNPTEYLVGEIKTWPTDTAPAGFVFCNGQSLARTTYATLFAVIGTTYGAADGSHFNVPDYCGRAPFGSTDMGAISDTGRITNAGSGIVGATLGATGGAETVTLSTSQIPAHNHPASTSPAGSHNHSGSSTTVGEGLHTHSGTTGTESQSHTHNLSVPSGYIGQLGTSSAAAGVTPTSQATGTASQTHTHDFSISSSGTHIHSLQISLENDHTHTVTVTNTGGGGSHSNMPPTIIQNFIIRY